MVICTKVFTQKWLVILSATNLTVNKLLETNDPPIVNLTANKLLETDDPPIVKNSKVCATVY